MTIVTIHKAKTTLSQLIKRAAAGEVIEIARGDKVVAKIIPNSVPELPEMNLGRGAWKHLAAAIPDSAFFDPLPEEELRLWEGGD
jgi:antitoxin (DNA-binding transcriptional repressor) of toxin-antitoxin stability system